MAEQVDLVQMQKGQSGVLDSVEGGKGMTWKLDALGIRPGCAVKKISSALGRGPVVLRVNGADVALGFGMAKKIRVRVSPNGGGKP
jgi:ferrous iron transport protein A